MKKKIILDLCGGTSAWSKPYKDAGYEVEVITLPDWDVTNVSFSKKLLTFRNISGNHKHIRIDEIHGILAAPPCTEFSIAKNKWERDLEGGAEVVNACLEIIRACKPKFWALENPIGVLGKMIGKHKYSFQPWYFGDGWTKRTMLWGEFNLPKRRYATWEQVPKIKGLYIRPNRKTPSIAFNHKSAKKFIRSFDAFEVNTDAEFRAITPQGFAKAFFKANP